MAKVWRTAALPLSGRVSSGSISRPTPHGVSKNKETKVPSTTAEFIQLGQLVDHHAFALKARSEPLAWARETVRWLMKDRSDQGRIDDTVLVATELLTNAIRHAGGPVSFTLDLYEEGVTVGVVDCGTDTTAIPAVPVSLLADLNEGRPMPSTGSTYLKADKVCS